MIDNRRCEFEPPRLVGRVVAGSVGGAGSGLRGGLIVTRQVNERRRLVACQRMNRLCCALRAMTHVLTPSPSGNRVQGRSHSRSSPRRNKGLVHLLPVGRKHDLADRETSLEQFVSVRGLLKGNTWVTCLVMLPVHGLSCWAHVAFELLSLFASARHSVCSLGSASLAEGQDPFQLLGTSRIA